MSGIEVQPGLESVLVLREVILGLRNVREKDFISVGEGLAVILIWGHGRPGSGCDGVSLLLIARLWRREGRHIHVSGHVRHATARHAGVGGFRLVDLLESRERGQLFQSRRR